jgi:uncharacterized membrane protein YhdT
MLTISVWFEMADVMLFLCWVAIGLAAIRCVSRSFNFARRSTGIGADPGIAPAM